MGQGDKYEDYAEDARGVACYGVDETGVIRRVLVDAAGRLTMIGANALVPKVYDHIAVSYTGDNLTGVVYKTGGSGGTTVATLTLGYDGSGNITSVART